MEILGGSNNNNHRSLKNPFSIKKKKSKLSLLSLLILIVIVLSLCFIFLLVHIFQTENSSTDDTAAVSNGNDNKIYDNFPSIQQQQDNYSNSSNSSSSSNNNYATTDKTKNEKSAPIIAYAISLTSCNSDSPSLVDGAATLAHSIHLNSIRNQKSKYDYKLYAFFHTSIIENDIDNINDKKCSSILQNMGYEIKIVDIPVPLDDIQNEYLRTKLPSNGCCGEKEFIKLWSYTLVNHPFVVHLDLDTIVLRPMDELFDYGLYGIPLSQKSIANRAEVEEEERKKDIIMWNIEERNSNSNWSNINAFFTRDYNMRPAGKKPVGVQGGFLIVRPSYQVFQEYQSIIKEGNFDSHKGWGNLGYQFYGAMTFQGIIPYYYDVIAPNTSIELNRCVYNAMADNPRDKRTVNNKVDGKCRDGRVDCEDCRERDVSEVRTAHFTLCQKPWECLSHEHDMLQHRLCRKLFGEWYKVRADLELSWEGKSLVDEERLNGGKKVVVGEGKYDGDLFRGFCKGYGKNGYIPMKLPESTVNS